jgi:oligopeptide transport system substrate-binding protein
LHKIIFITSLFFLIGCSDSNKKNVGKTVFNYNEASNISSLDPAFARDYANIWAVSQLFNGLVQLDDHLKIIPCIAKTLEVSDDGKHYTFHLRNDVFFQDDPLFIDGKGRRISANDFVYSFNRIRDNKTASPGAWIFNNVEDVSGFVANDDSLFPSSPCNIVLWFQKK